MREFFKPMRISRGPALIVATLLLAAWLAAAASIHQAAKAPGGIPSVAPPGPDSIVIAVQAQGERLAERLRSAPQPLDPARNPFTFGARVPRPVPTPAASEPAAEEVSPQPPSGSVSLIGIAENRLPERVERMAFLTGEDGLVLAREGESVAGHFRVVRIGADAVELVDDDSGASLTLALP